MNATEKRKFHFSKDYLTQPLSIGDLQLVQIGRTHCSQDYFVGEHPHLNWFEITHVTGGSGRVITNGVTTRVKGGDLYLSFPGDIHAIYSDNDDPLKFNFLSVWPSNEHIHALLEEIMVRHNNPDNRTFTDSNVEHLIENSIAEVILNDTFSEEMLAFSLNQVLRYVIRDFSTENTDRKLKVDSSEELCYQIMNYITTHIYTMERLEELSAYFGYNYGYLSGLFHKTTGETLMQYYTAHRLDSAKALINEGLLSFAEIAETLKYSSVYAFSRAFKRSFGHSPSAFKKQIKQ